MTDARELSRAVIENAAEIGNKLFANVPLSTMDIDYSYQRKPSNAALATLINNWDISKCDVIILSYRDDKFYILDGQHRYFAALKNEVNSLPAQIRTGLSRIEEAAIFANQDQNVTRVSPFDSFKANQVAGDEVDIGIKEVLDKYSIIAARTSPYTTGNITSITTARSIYKVHGKKGFTWCISTVKKSGWHNAQKAYGCCILRALKGIYEEYQGEIGEITEPLIKILRASSPMGIITASRSRYSQHGDTEACFKYLVDEFQKVFEKSESVDGNLFENRTAGKNSTLFQ